MTQLTQKELEKKDYIFRFDKRSWKVFHTVENQFSMQDSLRTVAKGPIKKERKNDYSQRSKAKKLAIEAATVDWMKIRMAGEKPDQPLQGWSQNIRIDQTRKTINPKQYKSLIECDWVKQLQKRMHDLTSDEMKKIIDDK
jgi:hypothetical protein